MSRKLLSLLLMIAMIFTSLPMSGMINAATPTDEYPIVYYSDLFWGYDPSYFKTDYLADYRRSTYDINFKVYTEYLDSPNCFWTTIKTAMLSTTNIIEWLKLMCSVPEVSSTDYTYNNALDNANKLIAANMLNVVSNQETLEKGTAFHENAETMFEAFDLIGKTVLTPDIRKNLDTSGIFSAFFGEIYDLDVFPELKNNNLDMLLDSVKEVLGGIGAAYEAVCAIVKLVSFFAFDVASDIPELDAILTQRVLCNYADDLYNIILDRGTGMVYEEMLKDFKAEDVKAFEYIFDMFVTTTECALKSSRELALDSNRAELETIINDSSSFNYQNYILGVRESILHTPASERKYKHFENWNLANDMYFAEPSDELERA